MNTEQLKTAKDHLLAAIPKDCWWAEMENLTNTPVEYVLSAMNSFAAQEVRKALKAEIKNDDTLYEELANEAVDEFKEKLRSEVTKRIDDHHSIGSMEVLTEKEIFDLIDKL